MKKPMYYCFSGNDFVKFGIANSCEDAITGVRHFLGWCLDDDDSISVEEKASGYYVTIVKDYDYL